MKRGTTQRRGPAATDIEACAYPPLFRRRFAVAGRPGEVPRTGRCSPARQRLNREVASPAQAGDGTAGAGGIDRWVTNGTTALECAYRAVGVEAGDEVVCPATTFIATATAAVMVGGVPVFVDTDPETYTVSPAALEAAITPRTRCVAVVDYGGLPCDYAIGAGHSRRAASRARWPVRGASRSWWRSAGLRGHGRGTGAFVEVAAAQARRCVRCGAAPGGAPGSDESHRFHAPSRGDFSQPART